LDVLDVWDAERHAAIPSLCVGTRTYCSRSHANRTLVPTRTELSLFSFQRSALECPPAALRPANQNQARTISEQELSRYSRSNALRWNAPRPLCGPRTKPGPHNSGTRTLSILSFQRSALECPSAALRPANQNQALTIPDKNSLDTLVPTLCVGMLPRPLCGLRTKTRPSQFQNKNSLDTLVPTLCVGMPLGRSAARKPKPGPHNSRTKTLSILSFQRSALECSPAALRPANQNRPAQFQNKK